MLSSSLIRSLGAGALLLQASLATQATLIADSAADYSGVQGQDDWFYGQFNETLYYGTGGFPGYNYLKFEAFAPSIFRPASQAWDVLPVDGAPWTSISRYTTHPNGGFSPDPTEIWTVRRWVSDYDGEVDITGRFEKHNPNYSQQKLKIFDNGILIYVQELKGSGDVGYDFAIHRTIHTGDIIDFTLDPWGSSRSDGTWFHAQIDSVPDAPASLDVAGFALALGGLAVLRRKA